MSRLRWLLAVLAVAVAPTLLAAQERGTITGTVVDQATQRPLQGVQVTVGGTQLGTITNQQGRFLIPNVPTGTREVRASLIGFGTASQTVNVQTGVTATLELTLAQTAIGLDELVVTATGQVQRRRETGNAVGTVNVAQVELAPVTNVTQLLQGRVAGATVMQSSGTTGGGARIRIRGNNSISLSNAPLLIVDGVRVENSEGSLGFGVGGQAPSRLNDLNPEDIESIEILKGPAAAALYGTAAANGVIQVTTRRGRAGQTAFRVWSEYGALREQTAFPDNVWAIGNLVTAAGPVATPGRCDIIRQAIGANPTGNQVGCTGITQTFRQNPLEEAETSPFRNGNRQSVGASVSGGVENVTYYISADHENETGVQPDNQLRRIRVQANTTGRVGDRFTIGSSVSYLDNRHQLPLGDNALFGIVPMGLFGLPTPQNIELNQGFEDDPQFFYDWRTFQDYSRIQGSLRGDYQPIPWLALNGTAGIDRYARQDVNRLPRETVYRAFGGVYTQGFIQNNTYDIWNLTTNASATATFNLRDDLVSTSAVGTQYIRENFHSVYAFGAGLTPGVETSLAGATADFSASESNALNATASAYVQQQLGWRDRVFLTGALRGDQNTSFGLNLGWVWYPSFSASWVVSEEPFFPQVGFLSNLRLRTAWGRSGLRPGPSDAIQAFGSQVAAFGAQDVAAITFNLIGNPDLRPEVATELEVGFESGFFDDRLGLEMTYFTKTSRDALVSQPLPPSLGAAGSRFANLGQVDNSGLEFAINGSPIRGANVQWNLNVTGSFLRNRLVSLGLDAQGNPIPPIVFGTQQHREGYPLGSYFHFPITAWADANGDGLLSPTEVTVDRDTMVYLGNPFPTREFSVSTDIGFRNWVRFSTLLDFKGGHQMLNSTRAWRCSPVDKGNCEDLYDRNTPLEQQAAMVARSNYRSNAGWIEDADFLKLREVALTFGLPEQFARQVGARGLNLTVAGRNLATWTDYSGFDPEVNFAGQANFTTGDFATLPPNRYFTVRIDANF